MIPFSRLSDTSRSDICIWIGLQYDHQVLNVRLFRGTFPFSRGSRLVTLKELTTAFIFLDSLWCLSEAGPFKCTAKFPLALFISPSLRITCGTVVIFILVISLEVNAKPLRRLWGKPKERNSSIASSAPNLKIWHAHGAAGTSPLAVRNLENRIA